MDNFSHGRSIGDGKSIRDDVMKCTDPKKNCTSIKPYDDSCGASVKGYCQYQQIPEEEKKPDPEKKLNYFDKEQ